MSAPYLEAVRDSWERIAEALRDLPPAYSVIVTADHGGHDRTHGVDCPEDMHTPLLLRGPRFTPGSTLPRASILDLAPSVAALLGVPADPEWEGRSLL